jgi:hypothetical protein
LAAPASVLPVAKALSYNSQGKQIAEAKNVVLRARDVLHWLPSTGAVNPMDMKLPHILTGAFKERASVMYTLELAQLVATPQKIAVLANDSSHDTAIVIGAAETVEAKIWANLFEFKNSSVAINMSQQIQKTKSYNAFGSRVKAYTEEVKAKLHSNASWKDHLYWDQTSCIAVQGRQHREPRRIIHPFMDGLETIESKRGATSLYKK